eukprot:545121-Amphidinium_carterae.1
MHLHVENGAVFDVGCVVGWIDIWYAWHGQEEGTANLTIRPKVHRICILSALGFTRKKRFCVQCMPTGSCSRHHIYQNFTLLVIMPSATWQQQYHMFIDTIRPSEALRGLIGS